MRALAWDGTWPSFSDSPGVPFRELGFDSLAELETHVRIRNYFGVEIHDVDLDEVRTPKGLLDYVNRRAETHS